MPLTASCGAQYSFTIETWNHLWENIVSILLGRYADLTVPLRCPDRDPLRASGPFVIQIWKQGAHWKFTLQLLFHISYCIIPWNQSAVHYVLWRTINFGIETYKRSTHWGREQIDAMSQTTFSNAFFENGNEWILLRISLRFVSKGPINNIPSLVQTMAWRGQATIHCLNQWWLIYWRIYASLGLNELMT